MQDLNNVARVSKRLYNNGTDPFLWTNFNLKVKFKKIESHRVLFIAQTLGKVTKINRLRLLNTIELCDNDLSSVNPEVLGTRAHIVHLKEINITHVLLFFKGILVNNVEDCDISYTDLTSEQVCLRKFF